jgi:hypothetical protein
MMTEQKTNYSASAFHLQGSIYHIVNGFLNDAELDWAVLVYHDGLVQIPIYKMTNDRSKYPKCFAFFEISIVMSDICCQSKPIDSLPLISASLDEELQHRLTTIPSPPSAQMAYSKELASSPTTANSVLTPEERIIEMQYLLQIFTIFETSSIDLGYATARGNLSIL